MGFTPLYVALSVGAEQCAALLEEAGAVYEVPKKPTPGFRTCLDVKVFLPEVRGTTAHLRGENLNRRPYFGQY